MKAYRGISTLHLGHVYHITLSNLSMELGHGPNQYDRAAVAAPAACFARTQWNAANDLSTHRSTMVVVVMCIALQTYKNRFGTVPTTKGYTTKSTACQSADRSIMKCNGRDTCDITECYPYILQVRAGGRQLGFEAQIGAAADAVLASNCQLYFSAFSTPRPGQWHFHMCSLAGSSSIQQLLCRAHSELHAHVAPLFLLLVLAEELFSLLLLLSWSCCFGSCRWCCSFQLLLLQSLSC